MIQYFFQIFFIALIYSRRNALHAFVQIIMIKINKSLLSISVNDLNIISNRELNDWNDKKIHNLDERYVQNFLSEILYHYIFNSPRFIIFVIFAKNLWSSVKTLIKNIVFIVFIVIIFIVSKPSKFYSRYIASLHNIF